MVERIYLTTSFKEKEEAKLAGAKWDATDRKWWVTDDMDLAPFSKWLPDEIKNLPTTPKPKSLDEEFGKPPDNAPQISVRDILLEAHEAVAKRFEHDVWLVAQITKIKREPHLYLTLSDADIAASKSTPSLDVNAFGAKADKLWDLFIEDTGQELSEGLNIRVKIQVQFHSVYGLQGKIKEIDPTVTLGTIEERMKKIRALLKKEQIWEKNKLLAAPKDFCHIAVIHPKAASGFNDFKQDADFLERLGLLRVNYITATFEGNNAEPTLLEAFGVAQGIHQKTQLDALCLVRGGGSRSGLLNLSTEKLARAICEAAMPVFTGIGHAEDKLLLDEVAFKTFDTPSKVIGHIRDKIKFNADQAMKALEEINKSAHKELTSKGRDIDQLQELIKRDAKDALDISERVSRDFERDIVQFVKDEEGRWKTQKADIQTFNSNIHSFIPLKMKEKKRDLKDQIDYVSSSVSQVCDQVQSLIDNKVNTISITSKQLTFTAQKTVGDYKAQLGSRSKQHLEANENEVDDLREFIQQMGPEKTMKRGYLLAFDQNNKVIKNAKDTNLLDKITLKFNDDTIIVVRKE